jgi:uncharacterized membrane protein YdjX (TVP38/TMEM64 family)
MTAPDRTGRLPRELVGRVLALVTVVGAVAALSLSSRAHAAFLSAVDAVTPLIAAFPIWGAVIFAALAALSSMLVFFSSVLIVPIGVVAWGPVGCALLLWGGWFAGGVVSYMIGRRLGRPVVRHFVAPDRFEKYNRLIPRTAPLSAAFLLQLTLPSDVMGYVFGLAAYPRRKYYPALALAELPYAIGTVYAGTAFLEQNAFVVLALGVAAIGVVVWERRHGFVA